MVEKDTIEDVQTIYKKHLHVRTMLAKKSTAARVASTYTSNLNTTAETRPTGRR
jgi:hypothetical protein